MEEFKKTDDGRTGAIIIDGVKVMECYYENIYGDEE